MQLLYLIHHTAHFDTHSPRVVSPFVAKIFAYDIITSQCHNKQRHKKLCKSKLMSSMNLNLEITITLSSIKLSSTSPHTLSVSKHYSECIFFLLTRHILQNIKIKDGKTEYFYFFLKNNYSA